MRILAVAVLTALAALGALASSDGDEEPNAVTFEGGEYSFALADGELQPGINTITFRNAGA